MDDISLATSGICKTLPIAATQDYSTITTTQMTTVITQPSILELSCDFERPCSWNNTATSFNWMIINQMLIIL